LAWDFSSEETAVDELAERRPAQASEHRNQHRLAPMQAVSQNPHPRTDCSGYKDIGCGRGLIASGTLVGRCTSPLLTLLVA
jgi:hypothetical protein